MHKILIFLEYLTGGDRTLEGEASYRLGVAYEKNGDPDTALTVCMAAIYTKYPCTSHGMKLLVNIVIFR